MSGIESVIFSASLEIPPNPTSRRTAAVSNNLETTKIVSTEASEPTNPAGIAVTTVQSADATNDGNLGQNTRVSIVHTTLSPTPTSDVTSNPTLVDAATTGSSGSGLGSGAVAGIAIGALIFGAAIAFIAAFFLFKRRNRSRDTNVTNKGYSSYADSTPELVMTQQKGAGLAGRSNSYVQVSQTAVPAPMSLPLSAPVPASQTQDIAAFLPRVAPEDAVYSRVSALFHRIHNHVEMYYRDVHASITSSMEPELAQFGAKDVNMAELLQDCSSPTAALKHALVSYVLNITGPKAGSDMETLFPKELDGVRVEEDSDDEPGPNMVAATTLHRRISVYLFNAASPATKSRRGWLIDSSTHEAADHFAITFFPWVNPASRESDKEQDLASIVAQALEIMIWLFGEPHLYEFKWEGTGKRGVLVSPSLVRRTGQPGDDTERVIVEGVVVAV